LVTIADDHPPPSCGPFKPKVAAGPTNNEA
jgi:hypothetical protein